jgi:hypothetical protein
MYLQTVGKNDMDTLTKYGIANTPDTTKLNSTVIDAVYTVMDAVYMPAATGSVNLLAPSRFTPQTGVNLKFGSF